MTPFQERIQGVIPALVTPLHEDFTVDAEGMCRVVRRVVDGGCHGFVVLGTSGEFAAIADGQRAVAIRAAVKEAAGKVPVIVGAGQPCVSRTYEQARVASDLGADGLMVNPPFYFPMTQDEIVRYYEGVVAASPLPVLLYNIPTLTKVVTEPATLRRMRDVGVQGTKDSSGTVRNLLDYLGAVRDDPDFRVIVGTDLFLIHALDSGACATTGMGPNLAPQLDVTVYDAWRAGNRAAAVEAQKRCNDFFRVMTSLSGGEHAISKAVLSQLGVIQKWLAPPKAALSDNEAVRALEAFKPFLPEFRTA